MLNPETLNYCLGIFNFASSVPSAENITIPTNDSFSQFDIQYGTIPNTLDIKASDTDNGLPAADFIAPLKEIVYVLHGEPLPQENRFAIFIVFAKLVLSPCFIESSKFANIFHLQTILSLNVIPSSFRWHSHIPEFHKRHSTTERVRGFLYH